MYFLGQASTYKFSDILRHTFAFGTKSNLNELRAYLAAHYGTTKDRVAVYHTGRTALAVALENLVPPESEVVVTGLTCFAVYEAVSEAGCIPIFADIDKNTLHFGPKELKTALANHPEARAVVVQNNLGIPCDIKGIEKICKKFDLVLIEDLAHSAGIHYKDGREAGTVGDAVILSFGKGKAVDTISGGALIFTGKDSPTVRQPERRPRLSDRLRDRWYPFFGWQIRGFYHLGNLGRLFTSLLLKIHFIQRSADADLDPSDRITYWQAKLALRQIKKFPRSGRRPIREPFFVEDREDLLAKLESAGFVFDDIWYSCPVSPVRYYRRLNFPESECPVTIWAAQHLINLPTWYPKKVLRPAHRLIERYEITEDAPETIEKTPAEPVAPIKEETPEEIPEEKPEKPSIRPVLKTDLDFVLEEMDASPEEYYYEEGRVNKEPITRLEEPEEPGVPQELKKPEVPKNPKEKPVKKPVAKPEKTVKKETSSIETVGGSINYSEVVYDKFERKHLNRTNILDNNINSDGTAVSLTKEERNPKKPTRDNLPKIRQYKRPEKGPETTEGKVW